MCIPATFVNFAYGSNMLTRRMRERAPSARAVAVAVLSGYELRWHKISKDGSGKCDVVPIATTPDAVTGVLYEILTSEKGELDKAEGLGNGYAETEMVVESESGSTRALVYYATNVDPSAVPYTWYKALVVAGAKEHSLPVAYIRKLDAVSARVDSNVKRAQKYFSIANAV